MSWFDNLTVTELIWTGVGFFGQFLFSMRFIYQWFKSEQVKRSVVPEAFWYFSLFGGITLLAYAYHRKDPVFLVGQAAGVVIYLRNIHLIHGEKKRLQAEQGAAAEGESVIAS